MPESVSYQRIDLPPTLIADLVAAPGTAAQLTERQAELLDFLARAGLEPTLEGAAPALNYLAVHRPDRKSVGRSQP